MFKRLIIVLFLLLIIFISHAFVSPIPSRKVGPDFRPVYGVSYSFEQAGWYGLDPRESYIEMLDEFQFDWVRFPLFWDQAVDRGTEGQRDKETKDIELRVDDLRFAIEEAEERNVKVIIALGAKTPYYPEYHWPESIASQVKFGEVITAYHPVAKEILAIDQKVVEELAVYDNIAYWQVENEPLIGNVNRWKIDASFVKAEVETVRSADPNDRPVILNHAATGFYDNSWKDLLPILNQEDIFAVNAFFKTKGTDLITSNILRRQIHIMWPDHLVWTVHSWLFLSPNFESIKKSVETNGNEFWILEMQAEPYIKKIEQAQDPLLTFTPDDMITADKFLRSYKIQNVGFWGIHFWQYRQQKGDSTWIETAKTIVNQK